MTKIEITSADKAQVIELLLAVFDQFKKTLPLQKQLKATPEMGLLEGGADLDSLEILNFLIAVEKRIKEHFGVKVVIFNLNAISQKSNPFASLDSLADYILLLFKKLTP